MVKLALGFHFSHRKKKMDQRITVWFAIVVSIIASSTALASQINIGDEVENQIITTNSPFSADLETLQKQINYTFQQIDLLRRAMTHASFSQENNRALSILGTSIIETSVSLRYLIDDIDVSSKVLNNNLAQICNVESSCAVDGMRLGLHKVIRLSRKTNSSSPAVVCGAFRAIFGAISIDTGNPGDAGNVFWNVHAHRGWEAVAL